MALTRLNASWFLNFDQISAIRLVKTDEQDLAVVFPLHGDTWEINEKDAVEELCRLISKGQRENTVPRLPATDGPKKMISLDEIRFPTDRKKAWFFKRGPDHRALILAFVNQKGSCSVRSFDADSGTFLGKEYAPGNYQDRYRELLTSATSLQVEYQPNLELHCKTRLPEDILSSLKLQIQP